jgi:hypothetical protein
LISLLNPRFGPLAIADLVRTTLAWIVADVVKMIVRLYRLGAVVHLILAHCFKLGLVFLEDVVAPGAPLAQE